MKILRTRAPPSLFCAHSRCEWWTRK